MKLYARWWWLWCSACDCDRRGASRHDCEQTTGRCLCKAAFILLLLVVVVLVLLVYLSVRQRSLVTSVNCALTPTTNDAVIYTLTLLLLHATIGLTSFIAYIEQVYYFTSAFLRLNLVCVLLLLLFSRSYCTLGRSPVKQTFLNYFFQDFVPIQPLAVIWNESFVAVDLITMLHYNVTESGGDDSDIDDDDDDAKRRTIYPRPRAAGHADMLRTRANTTDVTSVSGLHSCLR